MPDRKKVMKGLKLHAEGCGKFLDGYCDELLCPYADGKNCDISQLCMDAYDLLRHDFSREKVKTYGKLYVISSEAVVKNPKKVEQELYFDIAKQLMENGVLVIHSENTIPGVEVTYGWKLKGVRQK